MVITEVGAIERPAVQDNSRVLPHAHQQQSPATQKIDTEHQRTVTPPLSSTLTNLAQQHLAHNVQKNNHFQSEQTLLQSIDTRQSARAQAQAASEADAADKVATASKVAADNAQITGAAKAVMGNLNLAPSGLKAPDPLNTLARIPTHAFHPDSEQLSLTNTTPISGLDSGAIKQAASALKSVVQQNMAATVQVQSAMQSTQTLMQSIDASNSPRAQQEATAKAAATERRTRAQAAALSLSAIEQAQSHGIKPISAQDNTVAINNPDHTASNSALPMHPDASNPQSEQQQQQQQLLASIGQGGIFNQTLASMSGITGVSAITGISSISSAPLLGIEAITPIAPIGGSGNGPNNTATGGTGGSGGGGVSMSAVATDTNNTENKRVGTGLFNTRGNLQRQGVPDFTLIRQTQAHNVQQALALNQSLALSTSGQLQPSLMLQLGIGSKLFELMMFAHRRMGSLKIFFEANADDAQANETDPTLLAAQNTSQLLVALYLEYFFGLLATIRRHLEMKLGKKLKATAEEDSDSAKEHSDSDGNHETLQEMSDELDYIKRHRHSQGSNQNFHYSMILPRS